MPNKIKDTAGLREMLLDVISDVRSGRVESRNAAAISSLAAQILMSARIDLDAMKFFRESDEDGEVKPVTLTSGGDAKQIEARAPSPYKGLSDDDYHAILAMKKDGKTIAAACSKLPDLDKRLVGAVFYSRLPEEPAKNLEED